MSWKTRMPELGFSQAIAVEDRVVLSKEKLNGERPLVAGMHLSKELQRKDWQMNANSLAHY
ncbi:hypothetical protein N7493_011799 [Penicillium malachiteum]|uniref:Uncharacterized protein n=1 Tax=Penicillium malachiteum TaxID=1324776 RepID=A0AAD6HAG8_9EURO|nr:hypothetical protein N7493_011799 [Penicillium malachiteum]